MFQKDVRNFVKKLYENNKEYSDEVINTIIGIKVLENLFKNDQKKWILVVKKAKNYLKH